MPPINAARAAKARARLAQANSTLQHGEAATLTYYAGAAIVAGPYPCVIDTSKEALGDPALGIDAVAVVRGDVFGGAVPTIAQTWTARVTFAGATIVYQPWRGLRPGDALGTTWQQELRRLAGTAK